jgi:UDP-2,4-diacetamido-2,4,6-trideoxy-beta-L-altropyranose hydrolase
MGSNRILFRVDGNGQIGLGHIKRCWEVIKSLKSMDFDVFLVCQNKSLKFVNLICNEIELVTIDDIVSVEQDAFETLSYAKTLLVDSIFLDSYILDSRWEETVKKSKIDLIAFDDRCEFHRADLVINYRPNIQNQDVHKSHPQQKWLLGSKFIPLSMHRKKPNNLQRKVLIHAGGASLYHRNTNFFSKCIVEISRLRIDTTIVCTTPDSGQIIDQMINSTEVEKNLFQKIEFTPSLANHLQFYQWVIGPAGTALYEALLAGCTCISYSTEDQSESQTDSWLNLGHAFHLADQDLSNDCHARELIRLALSSADIDTQLKQTKPDSVDGLGPQRICEAIVKLSVSEPIIVNEEQKTSGVVRADSSAIWPWLRARNQEAVRQYSSNQHSIKKAEHLKWWVNLTREKYLLKRDGFCKAYFWHQQLLDDDGTFFVGGWFPAQDQSMNLLDAIEIITFQMQEAKKVCKSAVWLGNIEPDNKISLSISQYFGFKPANKVNTNRLRKYFSNITEQTICLERDIDDASKN